MAVAMTASESFNDFSCKTRSTRLVSKDRESSSVRFCGRLCLFLFVGHCEKRNWGKDKFSASLVENVRILFACLMTSPLADLKFVGTVGTGGPVKFFLAV